MSHLVEFLKINDLSQKEIADFWGVTESYVSRLCSGYQKLPKKRKNQLLGNSFGWDVSPLLTGTTMVSAKAFGNGFANAIFGNANAISEKEGNETLQNELAILRKENEMLRERLADKDALLTDKAAQIDFLKQLLTK